MLPEANGLLATASISSSLPGPRIQGPQADALRFNQRTPFRSPSVSTAFEIDSISCIPGGLLQAVDALDIQPRIQHHTQDLHRNQAAVPGQGRQTP